MARIFVGKIYCNDRFKILMEFFICLISYSDLFFGKIICKLYHNNSVKIYIDISSNPPSPLVEKHRFLGNPPSPPVRLRRKWMTPNLVKILEESMKLNETLQEAISQRAEQYLEQDNQLIPPKKINGE